MLKLLIFHIVTLLSTITKIAFYSSLRNRSKSASTPSFDTNESLGSTE